MTLPIGTINFNGLDYFNGWAMPNFYFHYTTAFTILRHNGFELGKKEFLGKVPGMTGTGKIAKIMGLNKKVAKKPSKKPAKKK